MANRILVATLFQGAQSGEYFLNIGPDDMNVGNGDKVYLVVQAGNVGTAPTEFSFTITYLRGEPFGTSVVTSGTGYINTPFYIGTVDGISGDSYSYTLEVTYNGDTYVEDPKIKINA